MSSQTLSKIGRILGGLLLLGLILAGSVYAVGHFRRPGSMTPIEAQSMEMELPSPAGVAPVELTTVRRGPIESRVRYTGQAVGYLEQEVTPRVTGVLLWAPLYTGDRVKRGQLLARLDTSQSAPQAADRRAGLRMAQQGVEVARRDYEQALALIHEAHSEVGMKQGAVAAARADLSAAEQDRAGMRSELDAVRSMAADAEAQQQSAQADLSYWRAEIGREQTLLKAGAVTQEEYQREQAQTVDAEAKVRQAQARIVQVQAQIRAAQANVQKSEASILAAKSRIDQAQSELNSHEAHVHSEQAAANSARQKIAQAQAGVDEAAAQWSAAAVVKGYSEIRSEIDGVVTQRMVSPGVLVNPGQTLLKIARIDPIRLQANVAEADLRRIRVGGRVLVSGVEGSGKPLEARITSIAPAVDPVARTGLVEAVIPNPGARFLPGAYVTLDLSTGRAPTALLVPTRALRYHTPPSGGTLSTQSTPTLWIAEPTEGQPGQFTAHEATVALGLSNGGLTEVTAGLKEGDQVITTGQDDLKEGDTVSPSGALMAAQPNRNAMPGMSGMPGMGAQPSNGSHAPDADHRMSPLAPGAQRSTSNAGAAMPMGGAPAPAQSAPHTLYTCLMHPEVVQDHPGNCPKCGMKLVPKRMGGAR